MKTKNKKLTDEQIKQAAEEEAWNERKTGVFKKTSPDAAVPATILSRRTHGRTGHTTVKASSFCILHDYGLAVPGHLPPEPVKADELRSMALDARAIWLLAESGTEMGLECAIALVKDDRISHNRAQRVLIDMAMQERDKPTLERRLY